MGIKINHLLSDRLTNFRIRLFIFFLIVILTGLYIYRPILILPFFEKNVAKLMIYNLFSNDAFYYFEIAKNIVEDSYSSFDGLIETNGYHPLWLAILVGIGYLIPVDSLAFVLIVLVVIVLTVALGALFFNAFRNGYLSLHSFTVVSVLYFFAAFYISSRGM